MFNMQDMMRKAQAMQEKLQQVQAEAATQKIEVQGGGGLVSIVMNGKKTIESIKIDPSLLQPAEKEMLEDLLKVTLNNAGAQVDEKMNQATADIMGPLAGKIKLPF